MTCVLFDVTVYGTTWQFSTQLSRPVFYLLLSQFMASLGSFPRSCPVLSFVFSFHSLWHHLAVFHAVVPSCLLSSAFTVYGITWQFSTQLSRTVFSFHSLLLYLWWS